MPQVKGSSERSHPSLRVYLLDNLLNKQSPASSVKIRHRDRDDLVDSGFLSDALAYNTSIGGVVYPIPPSLYALYLIEANVLFS